MSLKSIAAAATIAGGEYWLTAARMNPNFREGSRDGRPCFFVGK